MEVNVLKIQKPIIVNENFELYQGLYFKSKEDVQCVVKQFSIKHNISYCIVESQPCFWVVKCIRGDDGCE